MSASQIIDRLSAADIRLRLVDGDLDVHYQKALEDHQIAFLRAHKQSLVTYLQEQDSAIRAWLSFIGESDPEMIDAVLDQCRNDQGACDYYLKRAEEVPQVEKVDLWGRRQCLSCNHWDNRCHAPQHKINDEYGRMIPYTPDPEQWWRCKYHSGCES